MIKYISDRGAEFEISEDGLTGYVINGAWDFRVLENNIEVDGTLKIQRDDCHYSTKQVIETLKGVVKL